MSGPWDRPSHDRDAFESEDPTAERPDTGRASDESWPANDLWSEGPREPGSSWDDWSTLPPPDDFVLDEPSQTLGDPWAESWAAEESASREAPAEREGPGPAPAPAWTPEPDRWSAEPTREPDRWAPEPGREPDRWSAEPTREPDRWTPEPDRWTPEPAREPDRWTPEPVAEPPGITAAADEAESSPEPEPEPVAPSQATWADAAPSADEAGTPEEAGAWQAAPQPPPPFSVPDDAVAPGIPAEPTEPTPAEPDESAPAIPRVSPWQISDDPWGALVDAPDASSAVGPAAADATRAAGADADVGSESDAAAAVDAETAGDAAGWEAPATTPASGSADAGAARSPAEEVVGGAEPEDAQPEPAPSSGGWRRDLLPAWLTGRSSAPAAPASEPDLEPASDTPDPAIDEAPVAPAGARAEEEPPVATSSYGADGEPPAAVEARADAEAKAEIESIPATARAEEAAEPEVWPSADLEPEDGDVVPAGAPGQGDPRFDAWLGGGTGRDEPILEDRDGGSEAEPPVWSAEPVTWDAEPEPRAAAPVEDERPAPESAIGQDSAVEPDVAFEHVPAVEPEAPMETDVALDAGAVDDNGAAVEPEAGVGPATVDEPQAAAVEPVDQPEPDGVGPATSWAARPDRQPTWRPEWLPDLEEGDEEHTRVLPTDWTPAAPPPAADRGDLAPHATPARTRPAADAARDLEEEPDADASTAEQAVPWLIGFILLLAGMVIVLLALIFAGDASLGAGVPSPSATSAVAFASPRPSVTAAPSVAPTAVPSPSAVASPTPSEPAVGGPQFGPLEMVYQGRSAALAPIYLLHRDFTTEPEPEVLAQDPNLDLRRFAWSMDGSRGAGLYADLLVSIEPGAEKRQLADGIATITFGPDASTVYAVRVTQDGANDVAVVLELDYATGDATELARITYPRPAATGRAALLDAQFQDDGGPVRLYWMEDNQLRLYVVNGGMWEIAPDDGSVTEPERRPPLLWSPDGRQRIAVNEDGGTTTLIRVDVDGRHHATTTVEGIVSHVRWSPDSERVVFTVGRSAAGGGVLQDLFLWDLGDEPPTQITATGAAFGAEWMGARVRWREDDRAA
jgi:hypothetical protein